MPEIDKTVTAAPMPMGAVDTSVVLPKSVRDAAAQADARHAAAYPAPTEPPAPAAPVVPEPAPVTAAPVTAAPVVAAPPAQPSAEDRAHWTPAQWEHHAKSMEGRYRATQQSMAQMQNQMAQLGDELSRSQAVLSNLTTQPQPQPQATHPEHLLTPEDETAYGQEMIDFAKRAAREAVAPEITQLRQQNEQLQRQVRRQSAMSVESTLDRDVPTWRQINMSAKFKTWLRYRDIYSGAVRGELLNAAYKAADAARVVAFFQGFLQEEASTGATELLVPPQPVTPAARVAAVPLASLAAPGHAKPPSTVNPAVDGSKIFITRGQIAKFYDNVRKGVYAGRDQDRINDELFIQEAQRDNRIR